ncbi:[LysW]-aminoadipate/[LysW]-glutamate kinase [Acidianus sp. HS-5]|uniref:[LysW]-aminoadipate/[LysW]-glutamate kinase n=1 Tax=Acidianus sp. HS-5 TaxID=2886040 RepID=UPI001F47E5F3|nr:[LysW]-aminoadipate/[LysW]-glutamate kinase [Acidianus sp. HS-5]BDC19369.1 acetylaminoadipate kinase [Acidianus sp. HS-5]
MIVVKAGGRVIKNSLRNLIDSIISYDGKLIFVHGGGDIVTEYTKKMGIEPTFVISPEGIRSRYTSREELDVYVMVMTLINKNIVTELNSRGKLALGLSGADAALVKANRKKRIMIIDERGKKRIIEGGYTGKIYEVNANLLNTISSTFDYIILSPIAIDITGGTMLNVDGDQMAFGVASAIKADTLVILTDVKGVIQDNNIVKKIQKEEAEEFAKKVGSGMNRKILMASEALKNGVKKVVISSGLENDAINKALDGEGTVIE